MFSRIIIGWPLTAVFAFATVSAQSPATMGAIRCESCALTGQKPEPSDPAKNDVVPRVEPVFFSGALNGSAVPDATLRTLFIARVLGTSPLRLEMLDSRAQHVESEDGHHHGRHPRRKGSGYVRCRCVAINDGSRRRCEILVADAPLQRSRDGRVDASQRDRARPDDLLEGRPVVSELRKVTGPATWFHPAPATPNCQNRSGRLIVYNRPRAVC